MKRLAVGLALSLMLASPLLAQEQDVEKLKLERENVGLRMNLIERTYGDLKEKAEKLDAQIKALSQTQTAPAPEQEKKKK